MGTDNRPTTVDEFFRLFASSRRRYALESLAERSPTLVQALAERVALREHRRPLVDIPADEIEEIHVSLYHKHLPCLAEADLIRFDRQDQFVRLTDDGRYMLPLLNRTVDLLESY